MRFDDPNRPERGANLRDAPRDEGNDASGDYCQDGYTVRARRPRVPGVTEPVDPDQATRIEESYNTFAYPFVY